MRLIDADELLKEIKEYEDGCKMLLLDVDPRVIKQHIIFAPTIDERREHDRFFKQSRKV